MSVRIPLRGQATLLFLDSCGAPISFHLFLIFTVKVILASLRASLRETYSLSMQQSVMVVCTALKIAHSASGTLITQMIIS